MMYTGICPQVTQRMAGFNIYNIVAKLDTPVTPEGAAMVYENQTCTWNSASQNVVKSGRTLEQCAQDARDGEFEQFSYQVSLKSMY